MVPSIHAPHYRAMVSTHYGRNYVYSKEQCKAINPGKTEDQSTHDRSIKDRHGNGYASITTDSCCSHGLTATFLCDKYDSARHQEGLLPRELRPGRTAGGNSSPTEPKWCGCSTSFTSSGSNNKRRRTSSSGRRVDYLENQLPNLRKWLNRSVESGYD